MGKRNFSAPKKVIIEDGFLNETYNGWSDS
jgi:hypothetical protein